MTWKSFLARLRQLFSFRRGRKRRQAAKHLPDRRKRFFDWEWLEDRAFMEPPVSMLTAAAGIGIGVYAVNLALINASAQAASAPAVTPIGWEPASAGAVPLPESTPGGGGT